MENRTQNISYKSLDLPDRERCKECKGLLIQNKHEYTCQQCGLVHNGLKFESTYFILADQEEQGRDSSQAVSFGKMIQHGTNYGTDIGFGKRATLKDHRNQPLKYKQQKKFKRLINIYSTFVRLKHHETEYRILKLLGQLAHYLGLKMNIIESAAYFYKKIYRHEKTTIPNNVSLLGACVYVAVRLNPQFSPISTRQLVEAAQELGHHITPRLIIRDYFRFKKYFPKTIHPNRPKQYVTKLIHKIIQDEAFLQRYERSGIEKTVGDYQIKLEKKCMEVFEQIPSQNKMGRNPVILAAAVIYCSDKILYKKYEKPGLITQKLASDVLNLAEYTIREHFIKILKPLFINQI